MAMPAGKWRALDLHALIRQQVREQGPLRVTDGQGLRMKVRRLIAAIPPEHRTDADLQVYASYWLKVQEAENLTQGRPEPERAREPLASVNDAPQPPAPAEPAAAVLQYRSESDGTGLASPVAEAWEDATGESAQTAPVPEQFAERAATPAPTAPPMPDVVKMPPAPQPGLSWKVQAIRDAWPELATSIRTAAGGFRQIRDCTAADIMFAADEFGQKAADLAGRMAEARSAEERKRALAADLIEFGGASAIVGDLPPGILDKHFTRRSAA